jgi:hypothetical protein
MIFVGEHTSYTHAWIASAVESGIRGSVQLLLELGLVDEAKATVEKWMARWIDVVSATPFLSGTTQAVRLWPQFGEISHHQGSPTCLEELLSEKWSYGQKRYTGSSEKHTIHVCST